MSGAASQRAPAVPPATVMARAHRLARTLTESGARRDEVRIDFVPGRIEVLGKHTDYAGGRSLLAATEQGLVVASAPRADPRLRILDAGRGERTEIEIGPKLTARAGHWSAYPATVARRLARDVGGELRGAEVVFDSDLPAAAGLSSSSALVVAFFRVLAAANRLSEGPELRRVLGSAEELAAYLGAVENGRPFGHLAGDRGVGTLGGNEDHTAILCARPGRLAQVRFLPTAVERTVAVPAGWSFAVAVSGVRAEKAGAARADYNRAARLAGAAAELWRRQTGGSEPHLGAIAARGAPAVRRLLELAAGEPHPEFASAALAARCEQFFEESESLVPEAASALAAGDLDRFHAAVSRSQELAAGRLGNQIPETRFLAAEAPRAGAAAASAFGAGFGGAVWALVPVEGAAEFLDRWAGSYRRRFPERAASARFLLTSAAAPARALALGEPGENEEGGID